MTCKRCGLDKPNHARGLCSNCYHFHRDAYPRTRNYRPYTARERDLIRTQWGHKTAAEIAALLGRDVRDIYGAAVRFGAARPRRVLKTDPALRRRLVRLHARGLSDRQIGLRVGFGHATVARWLRRLGLASNCRARPTDPFPEATRQLQREAALRRIAEQGLEGAVAFLRKYAEGRARAARMGWPQAETLLEARILDSLFGRGASTADQVVADLGVPPCHAKAVLRGLKRRGLVAVLYREGRYCVYGLAYGLQRAIPRDDRGRKPSPRPVPRGEGVPARTCKARVQP